MLNLEDVLTMPVFQKLVSAVSIGAIISIAPVALAQNQYMGKAVEGQDVYVDLSSISRASSRSVDFIYYQGNK